MNGITGYTKNRNIQMLISLMLAHDVRKVIISPGSTHEEIVVGLQYNGEFQLYSAVDERSAAYMAVGMATESGEPVAIICTESVASRNYYAAMTEAHYRQLPILAITAVHMYSSIGHLKTQVIDRSISPVDTFHLKVHLPIIKDDDDVWESNVLINQALLELRRNGGGPVHIDLPRSPIPTVEYSEKTLYPTRVIHRYNNADSLPDIKKERIAIFIGTHKKFSNEETEALDSFCLTHNAVVFCGHSAGYYGKYRVMANLIASQPQKYDIFNHIELLIHIGGPAVDESTAGRLGSEAAEVWRVNADGEIRDTFKKLSAVFEMEEKDFFSYYANKNKSQECDSYLQECKQVSNMLSVPVDKLPFSNTYAAVMLAPKIPENSIIHFGMSLTLRLWSKFDFQNGVTTGSNTGTRGIDGVLSAFLGASLVNVNQLCYCIIGDLAFFYDMNSLGNRHLKNNVRILLVNDGAGGLMKTMGSSVYQHVKDEDADAFLAAVGHFGHKSPTLVKNYAENLGFEYLTASNKEEFNFVYERFLTPELTDKPMLFEIFTNSADEQKAYEILSNLDVSVQSTAKQMVKKVLGPKGVDAVKRLINNEK